MHEDVHWFLGLITIFVIMAYGGWMATRKASRLIPANAETNKITETTSETPLSKQIYDKTKQVLLLQKQLREKEEDENASPLNNNVLIRGVSRNAKNEYVLLEVPRNREPITITGMELRGEEGTLSAFIPSGWKLPFPGSVDNHDAVTLLPGDRAYIMTGHSPNGMSFELNKCTGYLARKNQSGSSIPIQCPSPAKDPLPEPPNALSSACMSFIEHIPRCSVPTKITANLQNDGSCQAFVFSKINYDTCVDNHKSDPDFFKGDWRIYLGRNGNLWLEDHDTIELLDRDGKLISSFKY